MTRGVVGRAVLGVWLGCFTAAAAQLPPEIMADRYLVEAEQLIAKQDYKQALELMNKIIALQEEHKFAVPDVFHFKYAQVALSAGTNQAAIDAVNRYLAAAGREGQFYREALEILVQAEQEEVRRRQAEERRRQAEAERKRVEAKQRRAEALRRENTDQANRQIEAASVPLARDPLRYGGLAPEMVIIATGRLTTRPVVRTDLPRPKADATEGDARAADVRRRAGHGRVRTFNPEPCRRDPSLRAW